MFERYSTMFFAVPALRPDTCSRSEFGYTEDDVRGGKLKDLPKKIAGAGEESVAAEIGVGVPTLTDIVSELLKPGRDVRDQLPQTGHVFEKRIRRGIEVYADAVDALVDCGGKRRYEPFLRNGTASKESEIFVADLIKELDRPVSYAVVSEAGASVYSARMTLPLSGG